MGSCCSTQKSLGQRIDMVEEQSKVDYTDDASPKARGGSKRWKRKKPRGEQVDCRDLGHQIDIPGRLIGNGSSKVACLYTQQQKAQPPALISPCNSKLLFSARQSQIQSRH
ncbi:hypothetical protein ACFX2I_012556 [Malus domestica]